ncbi:hypothetical protein GW17_00036955 [Ensete ventricosum]|nr:hypothetical protein GW17_00036955 [Ensete ventricosum]
MHARDVSRPRSTPGPFKACRLLFRFTLRSLELLAVASFCSMAVTGYREREIGGEEEVRGTTTSPFKLEKSEQVVKTEGGEVRVVRGFGSSSKWGWGGPVSPMHIGFIFMEPKTLFIPQYLDSSLILFVHRGEVRVGWIYKDGLAERQLKMGDIIHIPAGSTFYMVNAGEGQRLQIICSIDTSESMDFSPYQVKQLLSPLTLGQPIQPYT